MKSVANVHFFAQFYLHQPLNQLFNGVKRNKLNSVFNVRIENKIKMLRFFFFLNLEKKIVDHMIVYRY